MAKCWWFNPQSNVPDVVEMAEQQTEQYTAIRFARSVMELDGRSW
jgi:hypothetical protein